MKRDWKYAVANADAYQIAGIAEMHLDEEDMDSLPWDFCDKAEASGTFRHGICVSLRFSASHPCGLTFRWYVELEKKGVNGSDRIQLDGDTLRRAMALCPEKVRRGVRDTLLAAKGKLEDQIVAYRKTVDVIATDAATIDSVLRRLIAD